MQRRRQDPKKPEALECSLQFNILKYRMPPKWGSTLSACCLKNAFSGILDTDVTFEIHKQD